MDTNAPQSVLGLCECGCGQKTTLAKQSDSKLGYVRGVPVRFVRGHQNTKNAHTDEANAKRKESCKQAAAHRKREIICGHPDRKHGGHGLCVSCYVKKWAKDHPDANTGNEWSRRNPEKAKAKSRRASLKKYGMTIEDFEALWDVQCGKCANSQCSATGPRELLNRKVGGLHVDHDHETGKVRGLLCPRCNTALGHVRDGISRLRGLIEYLESHQQRS